MLADGFNTRRGRRGALVHHDAVNRKLRGRRGARLTALTSGGAIPDNADYKVVLEPENHTVGTVNEDFAVESLTGDVFQLGNKSYKIQRVERGVVRVEDAHGMAPSIPFWLGEAPGRSDELSASVSRLRTDVAGRLHLDPTGDSVLRWLIDDLAINPVAAKQIEQCRRRASRSPRPRRPLVAEPRTHQEPNPWYVCTKPQGAKAMWEPPGTRVKVLLSNHRQWLTLVLLLAAGTSTSSSKVICRCARLATQDYGGQRPVCSQQAKARNPPRSATQTDQPAKLHAYTSGPQHLTSPPNRTTAVSLTTKCQDAFQPITPAASLQISTNHRRPPQATHTHPLPASLHF